jgi:cytidylate kinase
LIIAVDGPAAAGKGTLTRRLAEHFDLACLDTGRLYRATGARLLALGADPADAHAAPRAARSLTPADLEAPDLRNEETAEAASKVAAIPAVRAALLAFQRDFATRPPGGKRGAILDGRDIGTVVCPDAPHKIFLTASVEVRALRRVKELRERGVEAIHSRVLRDMEKRDALDKSRGISPLKPAGDALELDTSDLDADAVFAAALDHIQSRTPDGAT